MIKAFGERAKRWAKSAQASGNIIAADESAFLEAVLEGVRRRARGESFGVAMFLDEDPNRFVRSWAAKLLSSAKTFDDRRGLCGAIAMGAVVVDGKRQPELSGIDGDAFAHARALWCLADSAVIISEAAYTRLAFVFGRWHLSRTEVVQGDITIPEPAAPAQDADHVVIWAGNRSADEIAITLCALEELHLPVYVVCKGGKIPDTIHRVTVEQAEPLLRSAAAIVDTSDDQPGTAIALARFGVPLAVARTSGAHEFVANVAPYDGWNRDSILAATLRALAGGSPHPVTLSPSTPLTLRSGQAKSKGSRSRAAVRERAPLVSVIAPTYNRRTLLPRALESIKRQDYPAVEIVVVNDAGEDISDIAERFGATLVRRDANGGHGAALNSGIERAAGKYIAFLDDDDIFFPDHLSSLVDALEGARAEVAHADALMGIRGAPDELVGFSPGAVTGVDIEEALVVCPFLGMISAVIRRDVFREVGLFDTALSPNDDYEMILRIALRYDWLHVDRVTSLWSFGGEYTHWLQRTGASYAGLYEEAYKRHPFPDRPLLAIRRRDFVQNIRAKGGIVLNVTSARLSKPARLKEEGPIGK
ncbi:MAG TPA: glycosyltransferase family A protein [Candidatus Baltobacteraceae bacterium]